MKKDVWTAGDLYEPYVGRWSRVVAKDFLPWLHIAKGARWLDVGCGTGALSQCVLRDYGPAKVRGVYPSQGMIENAKAHTSGATVEVGDAPSARRRKNRAERRVLAHQRCGLRGLGEVALVQ